MASGSYTSATTVTGASLNDTSYSAIIDEKIMRTLVENSFLPPLVRNRDIQSKATITAQFAKYISFSAASVNENADLSNTELTDSSVTITAGEVGLMASFTKVVRLSTIDPDLLGTTGELFGEAIARKIDSDLTALFSALNGAVSVGSSGANMSKSVLATARFTLRNNKAPGGYVFVGHPIQTSDLMEDTSATTGTPWANLSPEKLYPNSMNYEGSLMGVDVYQTTACPAANTNADRVGALMCTGEKSPLAYVQKYPATTDFDKDGSMRLKEIISTIDYGVGEVEDKAGVPVITDHE